MVSRQEKVRAGAFVVASVVLFIAFLVSLKYYSSFEETREYFFLYEGSVFGLDKGSKVAFNGVPVGIVSEIGFTAEDRTKIKVVLKISTPEDELPILDDTAASLKYVSLITGTLYVELKGGNGKVVHDPNEPLGVEYTMLDNLEQKLDRLDTCFNGILGNVKDLLKEENRQKVAMLLSDVQAASSQLKDITTAVREAVGTLDKTLTAVENTVTENREAIRKTFAKASVSLERMAEVLGTVKEQKTVEVATDTLKKTGEAASSIARSGETLTETGKQSLAKVDQLVKDLNQQLSTTLGQAKKTLETTERKLSEVSKAFEDAAKSATSFVKESGEVIESADKLLSDTDTLVSGASKDVNATLERIRKASEKLDQMLESVNGLVRAKGPAIERILDDLKAASGELREFSSKIREQPSSLIGRKSKDERKFKD